MQTTVKIDRLGHHGDGIAEGTIFAPRCLPGETVSGTLTGEHLSDIKILTPSIDRVKPFCKHYTQCGGCNLAHASDEFVAEWKQGVVRAALKAQNIDAPLRPTISSPMRSRRRASFSVRRGKKGALIGYHTRSSDQIVAITDCPVLHPDIQSALPSFADLAKIGASRKAELSVTVTQSLDGLDIAVRGGKPLDGPLRTALAQLTHQHGYARLTWEDDGVAEVVAMAAPPAQKMGNGLVVPPPGAFLQATEHGAAILSDIVCDITKDANNVIDLFAGCGTFTLPLAAHAQVTALESSPEMIAALDAGWRQSSGLKKVTAQVRDLFREPVLPDELNAFDAIVIDPPRAGAAAQVAQICQSKVTKIAYVSCNPVTFARDCAQLVANGYDLDFVQPVDQFRGSTHVELVAYLKRV